VLPAKLLKAANPVYPPDAMTNYITGDVKAEVTVDRSGHVEEVKVISGPQALRDAAVAALKQYQYAPATQAGKSVVFQATEVVKFWFNP
jgi:periplasmic protein TonB